MEKEEAIKHSLALANRSKIALLATNGADGYPKIKAEFVSIKEMLR